MPGVHQIEHHRLLIITQGRTTTGNYLVAHVQQRRNNLQAGRIYPLLLTEDVHQLKGPLVAQFNTRAHRLYAQPDNQLMAHLLENHYILVTCQHRLRLFYGQIGPTLRRRSRRQRARRHRRGRKSRGLRKRPG